jgi:hypothetical protein
VNSTAVEFNIVIFLISGPTMKPLKASSREFDLNKLKVYATSLAFNGAPSDHLRPERRLNTKTVAFELTLHDFASWGISVPLGDCNKRDSYINPVSWLITTADCPPGKNGFNAIIGPAETSPTVKDEGEAPDAIVFKLGMKIKLEARPTTSKQAHKNLEERFMNWNCINLPIKFY